jgi:hypothetical protein
MVLQCRFSPLTTHTLLDVVVVFIVVIVFLLSFNAFPLSLSLNQDGASALHFAAWKGFAEVVTVLVAANANLDLVDEVSDWGRQ